MALPEGLLEKEAERQTVGVGVFARESPCVVVPVRDIRGEFEADKDPLGQAERVVDTEGLLVTEEEAEKEAVVQVVRLVLGLREAVELRHRVREKEGERVGDREALALLDTLTVAEVLLDWEGEAVVEGVLTPPERLTSGDFEGEDDTLVEADRVALPVGWEEGEAEGV